MPITQNTVIDTITFDKTQLCIIEHNNKPWITSSDLAKALDYSRIDKVSQIYDRNKDEFNEGMTQTLKLRVSMDSGALRKETRIFSPRGCHLIAMFARTEKAKLFRKWVLDVLEHYQFSDDHGTPLYENDEPHTLDDQQPDIFPLNFNNIEVPFTYYKERFWLNSFNLARLLKLNVDRPSKKIGDIWRRNSEDMPIDGSRLITWCRIGRTSGERVFDLPTCAAIACKAGYNDFNFAATLWLEDLNQRLLNNSAAKLLPNMNDNMHKARALNNLLGDSELGDRAHVHVLIDQLLNPQ
jgi:prophage antirepressor-like protein